MSAAEPRALYLDTSAVLRATIEAGTTPEIEEKILQGHLLVTSRLSHVESARAFIRHRLLGRTSETAIADAEGFVRELWSRSQIFELDEPVCRLAEQVAPRAPLRALDSLHLATYVLARRSIRGLELVSVDERLRKAASGL